VFARSDTGWAYQSYVKAGNASGGWDTTLVVGDGFGFTVSLSANGGILAAGAPFEESCAKGVGGDASNDDCLLAGAAYVFE
jgi:hypothetical protein